MADNREIDAVTGMTTTGHEWDGLKELNSPLPRWWLWIFYATVIFSIGYWIVYPAWPLVSDATKGTFGWNSRSEVADELDRLKQLRGPMVARLSAASVSEIASDAQLLAFARAQAKPAFAENCAPCHGAGGAGIKGYANLNDDDWLWGGKLADIEQTIRHGVRSADPKSRPGNMPAFGRDGILKPDQISQVADYTRTLSGLPVEPGADIATGKKVFVENCAVCHGEVGKGNREVGAPNIADKIWLYASDKNTIVDGIRNGRAAVMPPWAGRLDDSTIKALTVYVHTFGGGEK